MIISAAADSQMETLETDATSSESPVVSSTISARLQFFRMECLFWDVALCGNGGHFMGDTCTHMWSSRSHDLFAISSAPIADSRTSVQRIPHIGRLHWLRRLVACRGVLASYKWKPVFVSFCLILGVSVLCTCSRLLCGPNKTLMISAT